MSPTDLPAFPFEGMTGLDVFELFAQLRERDPVRPVRVPSGGHVYLVAGYEDVRRVFTDPVFSRVALQREDVTVLIPASRIPGTMLNMDPPDHTRMRKLTARAFTTGAVERMRPRIQAFADDLVDAMQGHGPPVDFVTSFATVLPATVISDLLGVPAEDQHQLREWLEIVLSAGLYSPEEIQAALISLQAYLTGLIAAKRSTLIAARDQDDRLSEPELLSTLFLLIAGGYETTASILTNSVLLLGYHHPDQLDLLRRMPELIPDAVEELLRCVPMAWCAPERVALENVELSGVLITAGTTVVPLIYAANRDNALVDEPERLDLTRTNHTPHLAFGHGIHRCLGAPLGRLELQIAFATLLRRLPALQPAVPQTELTWKLGTVTVGPRALPVTW
ncbi:MAG: cytochrome P450 [Actinobacteria bacterium]|nr:MAG: cytochrome P450 [Actinomycetota bacterium]